MKLCLVSGKPGAIKLFADRIAPKQLIKWTPGLFQDELHHSELLNAWQSISNLWLHGQDKDAELYIVTQNIEVIGAFLRWFIEETPYAANVSYLRAEIIKGSLKEVRYDLELLANSLEAGFEVR